MQEILDVTRCNCKNEKGELLIEGVPAKNIIKDWRLKHHPVMFLRSKFVRRPESNAAHLKALRGKDTCWMNPQLFEEFCNFDPELEKLAKAGNEEELQKRIEFVFQNDYLNVIAEKFRKILPDLTAYFAAKAAYGGLFEKDRKAIKGDLDDQGKVEDREVCHLADCWSVRRP